jgi:hypothetical protein
MTDNQRSVRVQARAARISADRDAPRGSVATSWCKGYGQRVACLGVSRRRPRISWRNVSLSLLALVRARLSWA